MGDTFYRGNKTVDAEISKQNKQYKSNAFFRRNKIEQIDRTHFVISSPSLYFVIKSKKSEYNERSESIGNYIENCAFIF